MNGFSFQDKTDLVKLRDDYTEKDDEEEEEEEEEEEDVDDDEGARTSVKSEQYINTLTSTIMLYLNTLSMRATLSTN